jgi:hypothetical protein
MPCNGPDVGAVVARERQTRLEADDVAQELKCQEIARVERADAGPNFKEPDWVTALRRECLLKSLDAVWG